MRSPGSGASPLLDFVGAHEWIFRVDELYERRGISLPVHRKAFEILEHGSQASRTEKRDCVFVIFVEAGVEDTLIHEIGLSIPTGLP